MYEKIFKFIRYLIADYERSNFSISQRLFTPNIPANVRPILPPDDAIAHSGLSRGAIIGIAIAAVVLCLLLIGGVVLWYRRRKKQTEESWEVEAEPEVCQLEDQRYKGAELPSPQEVAWEAHRRPPLHEMDNGLVQEVRGREVEAELPGT